MNLSLIAIWTAIGAVLSRILSLKCLLFKTVRLKHTQYKNLYNEIERDDGFKFVIEEQFSERDDVSKQAPKVMSGFYWIKDLPPMYLCSQERELKAGHEGTDQTVELIFFRWHTKIFKKFITERDNKERETIDVYLEGHNVRYLGSLYKDASCPVSHQLSLFEEDVRRLVLGENLKTSAVLYGPPGNGKTTGVRNLARKYGLNIHMVNFSKEINNEDILTMAIFDQKKKIVLFEDFDNVFDGRKLLLPETSAKCSFDAILNAIDGIFNDNGNTIFVFTTNDLSKLDSALLDRPSRIKHKIEMKNPNFDTIKQIVGDPKIAYCLLGNNLDAVHSAKNDLDRGRDIGSYFKSTEQSLQVA
jgi:hypothetical protein